MVAAFDYCLHGKGGAAPSIDTAMHGLVDAAHVDHLHPDSGIALACAADGEELTAECFGDSVVWVPWRRPGFQLGLDIAAVKEANPRAIGCVLGGHGITAWRHGGGVRAELAAHHPHRRDVPRRAWQGGAFRARRRGVHGPGHRPAPERAATLAPYVRALASQDKPQVGHFTDSDVVLDFLASAEHPRLAALGTSCPTTSCGPRSGRSSSICRRPWNWTRRSRGWRSCTASTARSTRPTTSGTPTSTPPRCAARTRRSC